MSKEYHALISDRIFMGGAKDVQAMVDDEGVNVVVDLRGESEKCAASGENLEWINVPLGDDAALPHEELLRNAIQAVVNAYKAGNKVAFHCGGGNGRTGAVAYGTLLELGLADSIDDAEQKAKLIRPSMKIKPAQLISLEAIYQKH